MVQVYKLGQVLFGWIESMTGNDW